MRYASQHPNDPISVGAADFFVYLRIGYGGQGQGRYANLSTTQAERLAHGLLRQVSDVKGRIIRSRLTCWHNPRQKEHHVCKYCK